MLSNLSRTTLVCTLMFGLFLLKVDHTSADLTAQRTVKTNHLRATTLSLVEKHSASFVSLSTLFNTTGYLPGGFDLRAVKLVKDGELSFKYQFKAEAENDPAELCRSFTLRALKNWSQVYDGELLDFSAEATIPDSGSDDWIFVLSFPGGGDNLKNTSCSFNLVARTFRNNPDEPLVGFWSRKALINIITTGGW